MEKIDKKAEGILSGRTNIGEKVQKGLFFSGGIV